MPEIHERDNLLNIFESVKKAVEENNIILLKDLSNRTVHSASIYQDTESITAAVVVYALYKIFARPDYAKYKEWPFFEKTVDSALNRLIDDLNKNKPEEFHNDLLNIRKAVSKLSGHFKRYVEEVFRKALISKASRIYEHGVSMEQTASLLGVTLFELAQYTGSTGIADVDLNITMDIEKRLKKAMEVF